MEKQQQQSLFMFILRIRCIVESLRMGRKRADKHAAEFEQEQI